MNSYLVKKTLTKQELKKKINSIIGWGVVILFGFGLVGGLVGYSEDLHDGILVYIFLILPGVWMIYNARKISKLNDLANLYANFFAGDTDGFVYIDELSSHAGKESSVVIRELETLFSKGYFQNCSLQLNNQRGVKLASSDRKNYIGFKAVVCPGCGASNSIRSGSVGVCEYCGTKLMG